MILRIIGIFLFIWFGGLPGGTRPTGLRQQPVLRLFCCFGALAGRRFLFLRRFGQKDITLCTIIHFLTFCLCRHAKRPLRGLFTHWRKRWDSNPRALADNRISSQVVKTELGGIWRKITADERTPKMPCFQGFSHLFESKTKWKSESESLLRFRRVLTDFRESLLEFLIEPSDFSPQNHAFGSAWKAPVMPNRTKSRVDKCRYRIKISTIGKNMRKTDFYRLFFCR